jgi:hypothetical protein
MLEQRPFISIARIPNSFRQQVKTLLSKASSSEATDESVESVLKQLGSRGVGLSSLITMGGTHAAGALGFHLALSLVDRLKDLPVNHFVMPLDACDSFLRALTGSSKQFTTNSRADLLLISLTDNNLILTPIEIKSYGLGAEVPATKLPSASDPILVKAKSQIQVTRDLLQEVISEGFTRKSVNVASFAIWINALSALVEASIKLSPASVSDASKLRSRLQTLVSGEMQVVIGNPIITFFGHEAHGDGGKDLVTQRIFENGTENSWGLYSLNTSKALESVQPAAENSLEVDAWIDLVNWATEQPDSLQVPEGQHDEAGKPAHTQPENVAEESTGMDESFEETTSSPPEEENAPDSSSPEIEGKENGSTVEVEQDGTEIKVETEPVVETKTLSPEELASKSWPSTDGVRVQVGSKLNTIGEAVIDYWPGNTELTQMNFGVVGNLGTGKTQFLFENGDFKSPTERQFVFNLLKGQIVGNIKNKAKLNDLSFKTKLGVMGVRGTYLMMNVQENEELLLCEYALLEGAVEIKTLKGDVIDLSRGDHLKLLGNLSKSASLKSTLTPQEMIFY